MAVSAFESAWAGPHLGDSDTAALFSDTAEIAAMVRVEAALAREQGRIGLIPAAAGEAIAAVLDEWRARAAPPVHLVVGMLDTKAAAEFLRPLGPRAAGLRTVTIPRAEASYSAERLAEIAEDIGSNAVPASSVAAAIGEIAGAETPPFRVLICGSLYLAGHVLAENG
jgi:folylpolyglutamate synthase/dihydropteroate synthase